MLLGAFQKFKFMVQSGKSTIREIYKHTIYALYKRYVNYHLRNGELTHGYKRYLKKTEDEVCSTKCTVSFIFFSDLHWGKNNKLSPLIIEHVVKNTGVKRVFCGGDIITYSDDSKEAMLQLWKEVNNLMTPSTPNFYQVIGNHDNNSYLQENELAVFTKKDVLSKQSIGDAVRFGNGFSFYVDDKDSSTRFLCLDTGKMFLEEDDYKSISAILRCTPANAHIVVITHLIVEWIDFRYQCRPYIQKLLDLCDDYNQKNISKIELIIAGHVHNDYYTVTKGGIPVVTVGSDAYGVACGKYKKSLKRFDEQCVTVLQLDYDSRKLYGKRIGRGKDFIYQLAK